MNEVENLPNGGRHVRYNDGFEYWHNRAGQLHRLDGPARIFRSGYMEYWVDGKIPLSMFDILIIQEDIDHEVFPSATLIPTVVYSMTRGKQYRAYRLDPHDLALAILHYG